MVLGMKSKHKKGAAFRVDYVVHVEEIRPWPPSESFRSVQTVLLQWENGDENSGSFLSVAGDSNIVFNESFMLPLTLYRDKKASDKFRKNYLEFSLFEPRKDKAKGHLLATAFLNLADYVLIEDILTVNAPVKMKKSSDISMQPTLAITLELVGKDSSNSSPSIGLSYEASLENDDDDDESEMASFTDDDASSRSSKTAGSSTFDAAIASPSQSEKNEYGKAGSDQTRERNRNLWTSSTDASSDTLNKVKDYVAPSRYTERSMTFIRKGSATPLITSSPSSISFRDSTGKFSNIISSSGPFSRSVIANNQHNTSKSTRQNLGDKSFERILPEAMSTDQSRCVKSNSLYSLASLEKEWQSESLMTNDAYAGWVNGQEKMEKKDAALDEQIMEEIRRSPERTLIGKLSEDAAKRQVTMRSDRPAVPPPSSNKARLKHVKSVRIHNSVKGNGFLDIPNGSEKKGKLSSATERKESEANVSDGNNEWKMRVEMLEEELREAAAVEVSLYSVVPEHSSSKNKVHAPARRLSRYYKNACRAGFQGKRASAARAAVSGLVLVSKACGNDVPRLTFWLSNSIMLRSIITETAAELPHANGPELSLDAPHADGQQYKSIDKSDDLEDVLTFLIALERVESWLFSRIVESVWWQAFAPHMQPTVAKNSYKDRSSGAKKVSGRRNTLGSHEQGSFSIELWKKAFKDACERLCPIRAGGHECGCLSALVVLVMEQLVNRLDVAMFNAILRESAEEMPTDPLSDPISNSKVLPVPPGKSSFSAGAQLKNIIGNWSRWLTDLFGLEDDSTDDNAILVDGKRPKSFKAFRLLHALSDLMMLPVGMLADASTRKEVCPSFGPTIIERVLNNFVPDEFNPNPIPPYIIDALSSEEVSDSLGDMITSFPCSATPTKYSPPPAALLTCVGEVGSQVLKSSRLSTLNKFYTSDDELDELDSPLTRIVPDSHKSSSALARLSLMPKEKGGRNVVRYQLLREMWRDDE